MPISKEEEKKRREKCDLGEIFHQMCPFLVFASNYQISVHCVGIAKKLLADHRTISTHTHSLLHFFIFTSFIAIHKLCPPFLFLVRDLYSDESTVSSSFISDLFQSFHDKDFWIPKCGGHPSDGEAVLDSSSRIDVKRAHQLFSSSAEPELFPNKKQAVHISLGKSTSEIAVTNSTCWETSSDLPSGANQFIDRLLGVDTTRLVDLTERSISPGNTGNSTIRKKAIDDQIGDDPLVGLSMSYTIEEPQICISDSRIRKVNVNQVEDSENAFHSPIENNINMSISLIHNGASETSFLSMGQAYEKEGESQAYNPGAIRSIRSNVEKSHSTTSIADSYTRGDSDTIFGFELVSDIDALARPISSYDYLHYQSSPYASETHCDKQLEGSNTNAVDISSQTSKPKTDSLPKNKSESKPAHKGAPNSFPSNVRSLLATGILDGVPVKYVLSRQVQFSVFKFH